MHSLSVFGTLLVTASVAGAKVGTVRQQHDAHLDANAAADAGRAGADGRNDSASRVDGRCMAETICRLKDEIRWGRGSQWTPAFCREVSDAIIAAADEYALNPALVLAVMINESDLDETAVLEAKRGDRVFAKDGGLMGIRCVLGNRERCRNGHVKGLHWKKVMDPLTNIRLGAMQLAHYRDGGGIEKVTRRLRRGTKIVKKTRLIPCRHRNHAYWAHYNHGMRYISEGYARHYPHRVAVLYHALARALAMPIPAELEKRQLTVHDRGKRRRTADRPVGARYRELTEAITAASACQPVARLVPHR